MDVKITALSNVTVNFGYWKAKNVKSCPTLSAGALIAASTPGWNPQDINKTDLG